MERAKFLDSLTVNEEFKMWTTKAHSVNDTSMYDLNGKENPYLDRIVLQSREFSKYLQAKMEKEVLSGAEVAKQELPNITKASVEKTKKSMASMGYNKQIIDGA